MWILTEISPTAFNVLSDLTGQAVAGVLLFVLAAVYPYLIWEAVKHGSGVALDGIISPPASLLDAVARLRDGGSRWLLSGMVLIMLVATLSHTASDIFLEFVNVGVGFNDTFFLGTRPGDLPTYRLLGDQVGVLNDPAPPVELFLSHADYIARGLSRFSILPSGHVGLSDSELLVFGTSSVEMQRSDLALSLHNDTTARSLPHNPQVECQSPTEQIVDEFIRVVNSDGTRPSEQYVEWDLPIPACDYERIVVPRTSAKPLLDGAEWRVLDWSIFTINVTDGQIDIDDLTFGIRHSLTGTAQNVFGFSLSETEPAMYRENWRYGRRVQDGLSLILGLETQQTGSHTIHPDGVEFQVEYSLVTGPLEQSTEADQGYWYMLSSWSRNCPVVDSAGDLAVASFPMNMDYEDGTPFNDENKADASGCLIVTTLLCDGPFPKDNINGVSVGEASSPPKCFIFSLAVTLLSGIEVDPLMLAAYAGIAYRNEGINTLVDDLNNHPIALNSIAAAYIMTREIFPGTVVVEDVRARIGPAYICLLLLPLLFVFPLLSFMKKGQTPPVPRSIWDVLVLGQGEEVVPKRLGSDSVYPHCPDGIKFGITSGEDKGFDHLGLGASFVPLERPLSERDEETSVEQPPSPNSMPSPSPSMDSEILVEQPLPINPLSPAKTKRASPPYFSMDSSDS